MGEVVKVRLRAGCERLVVASPTFELEMIAGEEYEIARSDYEKYLFTTATIDHVELVTEEASA